MLSNNEDERFLPFGLAACEDEVDSRISAEPYQDLYLRETSFDREASKAYTYLIVGRRGAGKTAIAQSLRFNPKFENPYFIFVGAEDYHNVLNDLKQHVYEDDDVDLSKMMKVWERAIWLLIASYTESAGRPIVSLPALLTGIISVLIEEGEAKFVTSTGVKSDLERIKTRVIQRAKSRPVIFAIDTLERYSVSNTNLLRAIAALIQFAKDFNKTYSDRNIHIKVLMSGEIFPHLSTHLLENSLKSAFSHVFLNWKAKPLLRLIAYRFYRYLQHHCLLDRSFAHPRDWNNYEEVLEKVWNPYFGRTVTNARGIQEHTFPYILRHTQMRPRQLIVLCNEIAALAFEDGTFPRFHNRHLVNGVESGEFKLANEVINSFSPNFDNIEKNVLRSLMGIPMVFEGRELHERAQSIRNEWRLQQDLGKYSVEAFRSVVAELGIVGLVRKSTDLYIQADFEYSLDHHLNIGDRDLCAIHPMFARRFRVDRNSDKQILPFSPDDLNGRL